MESLKQGNLETGRPPPQVEWLPAFSRALESAVGNFLEPFAKFPAGQVILHVNLRFCLFQYRVRPGQNAVQPQKAQKSQIVFLCLLWPFPVNVPLPNFAIGSRVCQYLSKDLGLFKERRDRRLNPWRSNRLSLSAVTHSASQPTTSRGACRHPPTDSPGTGTGRTKPDGSSRGWPLRFPAPLRSAVRTVATGLPNPGRKPSHRKRLMAPPPGPIAGTGPASRPREPGCGTSGMTFLP